jgi:peptide/nickel transport system permease protein
MPAYFNFALKRLWQFVLVVFIGINTAYVITHVTPIDPVEQSISAVTSFGNTSPEAIADMRSKWRR